LAQRRRSAASTDEYGLTPKQRRYCDHLIADPDQNRRKAYIAAGYTHNSMQKVDRCVWAMMKLPHIQAYIQMRRRALRNKTEASQERIVKELAGIGFLDPADLFDDFGSLRHIQDVPLAARKAIAQIDVFTEYEGRGKDRTAIGHTTRIKFVDKKGALDSIARILGYFQQDKIDTDGVAKLMDMIGTARGGSTIGRLNHTIDGSSRPLLQLGANGTARKLLVHERDPESSPAGDDDVPRHSAAG
jgi:phage terminase small subunit